MKIAIAADLPVHMEGDTWQRSTYKIRQPDQTYVDFTGATLRMQVRDWSKTGKLRLDSSAVGSPLVITIYDANTFAIEAFDPPMGAGTYYFDLLATWPDGSDTTLWEGTWQFCQSVTR